MDHVEARLKDGRSIRIQRLRVEDKEKLAEMYASLSEEALRWAMPPYTKEGIERWISNLGNMIALVSFHGDRIVGHAQIYRYPHLRRKGTGDVLIYLHQDFHNVGLGTLMFKELLNLAKSEGMYRVGLHVVADNKSAIHLYEKFGFKVEGVMKDAYFGEDDKYHDELAMGLVFASSTSPSLDA